MSEHTHSEYVDGCYRCDLGLDEMAAMEREKPDPRLVNIAAQGIRISNALGAAECAEAALAALESAGWRIVKLEQVGCYWPSGGGGFTTDLTRHQESDWAPAFIITEEKP